MILLIKIARTWEHIKNDCAFGAQGKLIYMNGVRRAHKGNKAEPARQPTAAGRSRTGYAVSALRAESATAPAATERPCREAARLRTPAHRDLLTVC